MNYRITKDYEVIKHGDKPSKRVFKRQTIDRSSNPIDIFKVKVFQWLNTRLGLWVSIPLALGVFAVVNWDAIHSNHFYQYAVLRYGEFQSLPEVDRKKFVIFVARFKNDMNDFGQNEVFSSLRSAFFKSETAEIIRLPRVVSSSSDSSYARTNEERAIAQEILLKTGANIIVWGDVENGQDKQSASLFWVDRQQAYQDSSYSIAKGDARNEGLWRHLIVGLTAVFRVSSEQFNASRGSPISSEIDTYLIPLKELIAKATPDTLELADMANALADCLQVVGEQRHDKTSLTEAIEYYRLAADIYIKTGREGQAIKANIHNGSALRTLGEISGEVDFIREAISYLEAAVPKIIRGSSVAEWALAKNNIGNAYAALASLEERQNLQKEARIHRRIAIGAYEETLGGRLVKGDALQVARIKSNLANVLSIEAENMTELERARRLYEEAITIFAANDASLNRGSALNNLGNLLFVQAGVLRDSGSQDDAIAKLENAFSRYDDALKFRSVISAPQDRAATLFNQGNAASALAALSSKRDWFRLAVESYRSALELQRGDSYLLQQARTLNGLGLAYSAAAAKAFEPSIAQNAILSFDEAVSLYRRSNPSLPELAEAEGNLSKARSATLQRH